VDTTADAYLYAGVRMMAETNLLSPLISAAAGLFGVLIGGWLTRLRDRDERRLRYIKTQLDEFYAPLMGLRREIRAKGELRVKLQKAAHEVLSPRSEKDDAAFKQMIDYNNEQLRKDLVPKYNEMLRIFRDRMALAEPSTVPYFSQFLEFVELWNRWLDRTVPGKVVEEVGSTEEALAPFYQDLEQHLCSLRTQLRAGGAP
jgi:hypothetical protein